MRRKIPPLNAIRTFEAVARNGSFTRAAEELFVTEPAVSRAIKVLEDHFQTRLFERHPKGLVLTAEAKVLLPTVQTALDEIADVSKELYRASERDSLTLLVTPHISVHWLIPKLAPFIRDHPDIDITFINSFEIDDLMVSRFDVAIWWGESERPGYESRPLFSRARVPMCSPKLVAGRDASAFSKDFETLTLLHEYDYQDWNDWLEMLPTGMKKAARGIIFTSYASVIEAAAQGFGVALILHPMFTSHVEDGRLVLPFGTELSLQVDYHLVYPSDPDLSAAATAFIEFADSIVES